MQETNRNKPYPADALTQEKHLKFEPEFSEDLKNAIKRAVKKCREDKANRKTAA